MYVATKATDLKVRNRETIPQTSVMVVYRPSAATPNAANMTTLPKPIALEKLLRDLVKIDKKSVKANGYACYKEVLKCRTKGYKLEM